MSLLTTLEFSLIASWMWIRVYGIVLMVVAALVGAIGTIDSVEKVVEKLQAVVAVAYLAFVVQIVGLEDGRILRIGDW